MVGTTEKLSSSSILVCVRYSGAVSCDSYTILGRFRLDKY